MAEPVPYPFPGMDPWMQRRWGVVHTFIAAASLRQISPQLPADLYITAEERIVVDSGFDGIGRPDVSIIERPDPTTSNNGGTATLTDVATPTRVEMLLGDRTEPYLEVRTAEGDELVTSIEWVSPSNKASEEERRCCQRKRRRVHAAGANSMEIDLTRGGDRVAFFEDVVLPITQPAFVTVTLTGGTYGAADYFAMPLCDRLPRLPVPLRRGEEAVVLDVQPMVEEVWHLAAFRRTDYTQPCDPPLSDEDAEWAAERVAAWRESLAAAGNPSGHGGV